jgi:flagellar basal body-associated protein FliL
MSISTFHNQRGASNFLFIVAFAIILTLAAMLFLYFEFKNIENTGIQVTPDAKQLSEQEKKALLEKLRK